MKVIFVCGSLEPGRDGVGDYTRRLAGELVRQGHSTAIIALNDSFVNDDSIGEQCSGQIAIPVFRTPALTPSRDRLQRIKEWIGQFNPDWLSLQFVPFAFHTKGLPLELGAYLQAIGKGKRWHIMFHELWVGMEKESSYKLKWWGVVQRHIIRLLILKLNPQIIHTQTGVYKATLNKLGFRAEYLPLFSNIPINSVLNGDKRKINDAVNSEITLVIFGSIHPGAPVYSFAEEIAKYANKKNVSIRLTIIGRNGREQERWNAAFQTFGLKIKFLGEQPATVISEVFEKALIGISTTPIELIEKSGSVAAMALHGLPILCVSKPWSIQGVHFSSQLQGVFEYVEGNLESFFSNLDNKPPIRTTDQVASQLADTLQKN